MREKQKMDPPRIAFGEGCVVLSRQGQSRKTVANVLGMKDDPESGVKVVWLDRIVHRRDEQVAMEDERSWNMGGAISTVLTSSL